MSVQQIELRSSSASHNPPAQPHKVSPTDVGTFANRTVRFSVSDGNMNSSTHG